jgi:YfiH family protein
MGDEPYKTIAHELETDKLIFAHQVHGTGALFIDKLADADRYMRHFYDADIIITKVPDIAVGLLTADCLPLILFDGEHGILAAVHAGWRGTVKNAAGAAVEKMVEMGAQADEIFAYFGPCAHAAEYAASPELIAALGDSPYRESVLEKREDRLYFDMPRMNELQLIAAGILPGSISREYCKDTLTDDAFWSYRRDGEQAERQPTCTVFR